MEGETITGIIEAEEKDIDVLNEYMLSTISSIKEEILMNFPQETSDFYVDSCSPAHENGNDIRQIDEITKLLGKDMNMKVAQFTSKQNNDTRVDLRKRFRKAKKIPEKNIEVLKGIDRKIYVLTKCNTLVNRDLMEKRNSYLKKVKKEYNLIYGQRGNNYFNSIQKNIPKEKKQKKHMNLKKLVKFHLIMICLKSMNIMQNIIILP